MPTSALPISIEEARALVLDAVRPLGTEVVALDAALGRVLAEDVTASGDTPPFANSAMDGFAVAPGPAGRILAVIDEARAGTPATRALGDDAAIRISTGAPLPQDATAVVRLEDVAERDGSIELGAAVSDGDNVRGAGCDQRAGEIVLSGGTPIGAAEVGVAASIGRAELICARRPRVAALATGDELVEPGAQLGPGQIYDSNALAIGALARAAGGDVALRDRVGDDPHATETALAAALERADVVAICGGVSVGPHDHVKGALERLGVQQGFWRVDLRPGHPVWFGSRDDRLVFGLPGNPVSAIVCFALFAAPALRALQGAAPLPARASALLGADLPLVRRTQAVRVTLSSIDGVTVATPTGPQGSHLLSSMIHADALALIGPGEGTLAAGELVEIEAFEGGQWARR